MSRQQTARPGDSEGRAGAGSRRDPTLRPNLSLLCAVCCVLCAALSGCESLQKKLTRKPKHPPAPPTPITIFQDYSRAMTPLDRYRKHYLIFDYWNDDLLDSLNDRSPNPKRYRRASSEAVDELKAMQSLVTEDLARQMTPLIEEREKLDKQFQSPAFNTSEIHVILRTLEVQKREVHRQFFWRDVQDHLKPQESTRLPRKPADAPAP